MDSKMPLPQRRFDYQFNTFEEELEVMFFKESESSFVNILSVKQEINLLLSSL